MAKLMKVESYSLLSTTCGEVLKISYLESGFFTIMDTLALTSV